MTATRTTPNPVPSDPADVFLNVEPDLMHRYGIGRTKAYELAQSPGFVRSVVEGLYVFPLAALREWELVHALEGTLADPARTAAAPPVVLAPPPPGRPGRKPRQVA